MLERFAIPPTDRRALTARMISRAWSTPRVGIILSVLFLLYILASFVGLFFYEEHIPLVQLAVTLVIYTFMMVLIAFVNPQGSGAWANHFGMGLRRLDTLVLSPVLYLVTLPFLMAATYVWHLFLQHVAGLEIDLQDVAQIVTQEPLWLRNLYILMAIFVTPLFEEILFRGLLFPYLIKRTGLATGLLLVSLFFAMMHLHLPSFVPLVLLSAVLCLAYWRTGSLWVSIGMHAIFNAVSIFALHSGG